MPSFIPTQPYVPKFDPILYVRTTTRSKDGHFTAKAVPRLAHSIEKEVPACMSSCDQPAKPALREFFEIYTVLKFDLLKDTKTYAKFFDGMSKVVDFNFIAKHEA